MTKSDYDPWESVDDGWHEVYLQHKNKGFYETLIAWAILFILVLIEMIIENASKLCQP